jgi:VanZ family protein
MGLALQRRPRLTMQCFLLVVYAAILEAGQLYSPGRHASFQDLAYSAAGIVAGTLLLSMVRTRVLSRLDLTRDHCGIISASTSRQGESH